MRSVDNATEKVSPETNVKKEKKVARMRRYLIETTEDLIQDDGFPAVTLRKIADETGYNTATIYNYFKDLNELLLFSSLKSSKSYNRELSARLDDSMNAMERYICIFRIFSKHTFARPEIYYNMFYGKHSENLGEILQRYYNLFPEELGSYGETVSRMLACGDIFERERMITASIYEEGFATKEDTIEMSRMAVYSHEYMLRELCEQKEGITPDGQSARYINGMLFLLRKIKLPGTPKVRGLED